MTDPKTGQSAGVVGEATETGDARSRRWSPATLGRAGLAASAVAMLVLIGIGSLGPSVMALTLPGRTGGLPPYSFDANPSPYLVSFLGWAALVLAAVGLTLSMRALQRGWLPNVRRLVWGGVGAIVGFGLVAPMASADVLIYAAYGRMANTGVNPFTHSPADVMKVRSDPVIDATEAPWQNAKSVYGPVVSGMQWLASRIGGDSTHTTVWVLQVMCVITLIACALLVLVIVGRDPGARARAAVLGIANPLVIWAVMGGAHNEPVALTLALAAVLALRRNLVLAGVLLGLAGASKLSIGLVGVAILWVLRREPRRLLTVAITAAITVGVLYAFVGGIEALAQARSQSSFLSTGTPHRAFWSIAKLVMPQKVARVIVGVAAWVGLVLLAALLSQVMPKSLVPAKGPNDPVPAVIRMVAIYSTAWLLTAMYTLPWYDMTAWLTLGCVAASRVDRLMVIRTAMLSIGYVPGRDTKATPMPETMEFIRARMRDTVCPAVMTILLIAIVMWARSQGARWWPYGNPFRKPAPLPDVDASGADSVESPGQRRSLDQ